MMDRRQFLKAVGLTVVAAAVPAAVGQASAAVQIAGYPHFDPAAQYGEWVCVSDQIDAELLDAAKEILRPHIEATIPPQFRHLVEWEVNHPRPTSYDPLVQVGTIAWVYRWNR